jgi:hypothetical protein
MKLRTDYPQWYDQAFDGTGPEFQRMAFTRGGLSKREQFALFDRLGLRSPPHGLVRELAARTCLSEGWQLPCAAWTAEVEAVVYLDELQHGGNGKVKLPLAQALANHPDYYASLFVPLANPAVILRHVRFGRLGLWLRQQGGEDWRSNRADRETVVGRSAHAEPNPLPRVLWAIDFLPAADGLLAIDFNTAPDLTTLGEAGVVTTAEFLAELQFAAAAAPESLRQF